LESNRTDLFIWLGYLGKANSRTHKRESLRKQAINLKSIKNYWHERPATE